MIYEALRKRSGSDDSVTSTRQMLSRNNSPSNDERDSPQVDSPNSGKLVDLRDIFKGSSFSGSSHNKTTSNSILKGLRKVMSTVTNSLTTKTNSKRHQVHLHVMKMIRLICLRMNPKTLPYYLILQQTIIKIQQWKQKIRRLTFES
jgi:hypothetical protein